jgi:toxin ParE1/3/4
VKRYKVILHEKAEAELDQLYEDIALRAGTSLARNYIDGIYEFIEKLAIFPERGTIREGNVPGLRIIGYRDSASIAFFVNGDKVTVLGVFYRGRYVTFEMLEERL